MHSRGSRRAVGRWLPRRESRRRTNDGAAAVVAGGGPRVGKPQPGGAGRGVACGGEAPRCNCPGKGEGSRRSWVKGTVAAEVFGDEKL